MSGTPELSDAMRQRLAQLSPERRALLERQLGQGAVAEAPIPTRGSDGPAVLSSGQEFLWRLDQVTPELVAYNVPRLLRIRGALDVGALRRALDWIVARHEILRTRYTDTVAGSRQIVEPPREVPFELLDATGGSADAVAANAAAILKERGRYRFDLTRDLQLRATLVRLDADQHMLLLVSHHIACDEASRDILFGELGTAYNAFRSGATPVMAEVPLQYGDYAAWQRSAIGGGALTRQLAYWRRNLEGLPALQLPTDRPRGSIPDFAGARRRMQMPVGLLESLRRAAHDADATLFTVLLAAYQVLLARYSGQNDFAVGVPVTGRRHVELERLVGYFPGLHVMRAVLDGDPTFAELLARVRESSLSGFEHQDLPLEELELARGNASNGSLYQTLFSLQGAEPAAIEFDGAMVDVQPTDFGNAKLDLSLGCAEGPGGFHVVCEYRTALFDAATIDRMLAQYGMLLQSIAHDPRARIGDLAILPAAEYATVIAAWNATEAEVPPDRCVHDLVAEQACRTPDAIAVAHGAATLTYADLDARATALADQFRTLGVGPDVLVGVCLPRALELPITLLAILKAGGAYLPLDADYPADRLAFIVADSGASLIVTAAGFDSAIPAMAVRRVWAATASLRTVLHDPQTGAPAAPAGGSSALGPARPENLAYVIYTSGSTGHPKGVEIEHRSVVNFLVGLSTIVPMTPGDTLVAVTPLSFDISALELFLPLVSGARVVIASRDQATDAVLLQGVLAQARATHLQATPATWRMLVEAGWAGSPGMVALCGGEALPQSLADALLARGLVLYNLYGPTEATIWATTDRPAGVGAPVRIGRPMPNVRTYVLDASRHPSPIGVPGELWLGGCGLARGYRGRPDLTAERFVADPFVAGGRMYRTGDLVRWRVDGTLEFLGRIDFQVKLRGHRIELAEVESALMLHPGVNAAVAVVREDVPGDPQLVAYVIAASGAVPSAVELRESARRRLPLPMVPAAIVLLDRFPMTPNGKVDRKALPEPDAKARPGAEYAAPRGELEKAIVGVWSRVFGIDPIGVNDDFFDLGGHSLLAMRAIGLIHQQLALQVPITIRMIMEERTVARLATRLGAQPEPGSPASGLRTVTISRGNDGNPVPLSHAQQLLWLHEQIAPGLPTYHIPMAMRIRGPIDVPALRTALNGLVERHHALRTIFVEIEGEPEQVVTPLVPASFAIVDLRSDLSADAGEAEGMRVLRAEAVKPFDLTVGPVFRATLVRLADAESLLLLVVHHIVFDGGSIGVLARDLTALYDAARIGQAAALAPLPIQFADYAVWERNSRTVERLAEDVAYWHDQLDGSPSAVGLPTDRPRGAGSAATGARHVTHFPRTVTDVVSRIARERDATPFMVLLAAFQSLLHRSSGDTDIVVGSPMAGRLQAETVGVIGNFANVLPLRARFDGDPTFSDILAQVRRAALGAFEHQHVPQEALASERHGGRPLTQVGLFSVLFVLQDASADSVRLGLARMDPVQVDLGASKFDLSLSMTETPDGFRVSTQYRADLFDALMIKRLIDRFGILLDGMLRAPDTPVSRVSLLADGELHQVLVDWNATTIEYPAGETLVDLLEAQAERTPGAIAVRDDANTITFAELHERANAVGRWLQTQGAGPGEFVGVSLDRSIDLVVALVGVLKSGAAFVPIDPEYPEDRLAFMLDDAGVCVLLTQRRLVAALAKHTGIALALDDEWADVASAMTQAPARRAGPGDPAYMIYTSGSTGRPKGAINSHRGITNRLRWMQQEYQLAPSDAVLQKTPASFDVSVWEFFWPLMTGARLVMAEPGGHRDAAYLARVISRERITVLHFVPSMLAAFLDEPGLAVAGASVRNIICSGEALPVALTNRLFVALPHARLHNLYGPTEAAVDVSFHSCSSTERRGTVPIGRPVANTQLYVLDVHRVPVPIGVPGELYIGGVQVGLGYHGRPELTAERFVHDPFGVVDAGRLYRTGDHVRWLADGTLEFLGRLDFQVKLRGQRIELGEIEADLLRQPGVVAATVVVREDVAGDARLVGYFVASTSSTPATAQLLAALRRTLPSHMVPGALVALSALPLTPNGKLDRRALPPPDWTADVGAAVTVAPRTPAEQVIASIWTDILGGGPISVHGNFFELGGHSLLATQVVSRIVKLFRTNLPLRRFFEQPTIAGLAAGLIATEAQAGQTDAIARAALKLRDMSAEERLMRQGTMVHVAPPRSA